MSGHVRACQDSQGMPCNGQIWPELPAGQFSGGNNKGLFSKKRLIGRPACSNPAQQQSLQKGRYLYIFSLQTKRWIMTVFYKIVQTVQQKRVRRLLSAGLQATTVEKCLSWIQTDKNKEKTIWKCENNKNRTPAESRVSWRTAIERRREWNEKNRRVITIVPQWWWESRTGRGRCWWSWWRPPSRPPAPTCPPTATSTSCAPASSSPAPARVTTRRVRLLSRPSSPSSRPRWTSGTSPASESPSPRSQVRRCSHLSLVTSH